MIEINSDTRLANPDVNFRVSAGPGAGKTHWLVNHILGIIQQPKRLGKLGKVACLTFTNIAADTVTRRLGAASSGCNVGTVHSFLYHNVVKPYVGFVAVELGIDPKKIDGYDETIVSNFNFLQDWKKATQQTYLLDNAALAAALAAMWWTLDENGDTVLAKKPNRFIKVNGKYLRKGSGLTYKKMAWERGVVHPDDVIFFSLKILERNAFIFSILRARFPYLFVDEFQDSSPLQVKIFQDFATHGIFVGIIGDTAQSIYGFNGASPTDFANFNAPNIADYVILDNRRSSNEIIKLLNSIRSDVQQKSVRNVNFGVPEILVGNKIAAQTYVKQQVGNADFVMLSRNNETVRELTGKDFSNTASVNLLSAMASNDSNYQRRETVRAIIVGIVQAQTLGLCYAVSNAKKVLELSMNQELAKRYAIVLILELLDCYSQYESLTLSEFIAFLNKEFGLAITNLGAGKARTFYDKYLFSDIASKVLPDDKSSNRTIHKSKGDEFDNVLLFLEETQLDILISPRIFGKSQEEQRIIYVAFSRARDRLFINVPELSDEQKSLLPSTVSVRTV